MAPHPTRRNTDGRVATFFADRRRLLVANVRRASSLPGELAEDVAHDALVLALARHADALSAAADGQLWCWFTTVSRRLARDRKVRHAAVREVGDASGSRIGSMGTADSDGVAATCLDLQAALVGAARHEHHAHQQLLLHAIELVVLEGRSVVEAASIVTTRREYVSRAVARFRALMAA